MSTTRYDRDGLSIVTFAGPVGCNKHTGGRACVQIGSNSLSPIGRVLSMNMDHWVDLVCFVRRMDAAGHGILSVPELEP